MEIITCPWCGQRTPADALECSKCGGPLPSLMGDDPGPSPPLPPRQLPKGYKQRILIKNSPLNIVGAIFILVGLPFAIIFPLVSIFSSEWLFFIIGCGLGGLFVVVGGGMLFFGIRQGFSKIHPYELGQATIGEITDIYRDYSISVNGRNPWRIVYQFETSRAPYEGNVMTWQNAARTHAIGSRVHVLYMQDNPDQNVLYPPV